MNPTTIYFLLASAYSLVSWAGTTQDAVGRVVSVNGVCAGAAGPLKVGVEVHEGDLITTGPDSGVKLLMRDRSVIDIAPTSRFRVKEYKASGEGERKVALELDFGSIRASVSKKLEKKSHFTIRTKSSVLAVRGTEFAATWREVDGKVQERVTVSHGSVLVTPSFNDGKSISLVEGKQYVSNGVLKEDRVIASASNDPKEPGIRVATLSQKDAERTVASSAVEDKTFSRSIDLSGSVDNKSGDGGVTVSSVAIATGAKESSRQRRPGSKNSDGAGNRADGEKGDKSEKGDRVVSNNDVPGGAGIPGGSHSPGGSVPGTFVPPPTPGSTTITAEIKASFQ